MSELQGGVSSRISVCVSRAFAARGQAPLPATPCAGLPTSRHRPPAGHAPLEQAVVHQGRPVGADAGFGAAQQQGGTWPLRCSSPHTLASQTWKARRRRRCGQQHHLIPRRTPPSSGLAASAPRHGARTRPAPRPLQTPPAAGRAQQPAFSQQECMLVLTGWLAAPGALSCGNHRS